MEIILFKIFAISLFIILKNKSNENIHNPITEIIHLNIPSLNYSEFNVTTLKIKRKKMDSNTFDAFANG